MLHVIETRSSYNFQTGFGHVRVLPLEGDQLVSVRDLLENFPPEKVTEVLRVVKQHAEQTTRRTRTRS